MSGTSPGIFHYLYLVHRRQIGGSPTDVVFTDAPMIGAILGWIIVLTVLVYG